MNEEIKEILNTFKELTEDYSPYSLFDFEEYEITCIQLKMLLDYITNLQQENKAKTHQIEVLEEIVNYENIKNDKLQQDLEKANDIIQKDRQFYKCRMDEYAELKKENEMLRNEKAIEYIKSTNCYGMRSGKTLLQNLQNLIDKTTNYYLKTLAKNGSMPEEAVEMFNLLEGNK